MFEKFSKSFEIPRENIESKKQRIIEKLNKENENCDEAIEEKGFSRRDFLKWSGFSILGLGAIKVAEKVKMASDLMSKEVHKIEKEFHLGPELVNYSDEADLKTVDRILDFNSIKPIEINRKIVEQTKEYWKLEYMGNPKLSTSLINAYAEMKKNWVPKLQKIFSEEGVPEKYLYLAIPESHWNSKAVSRSGAVGHYQFMEKTARDFGLIIDKRRGIDERTDPLKGGRACAKFLRYLFDKTGDWDLALSGYNRGIIWSFLDYCRENSSESTYNNFLSYMKSEANKFKEEYRTGWMERKVKKGDTVKKLAKRYKISPEIIRKKNNLKSDELEDMKVVQVYLRDKKIREKILQRRKKTISENLNYPPKFNAVMELIKEGIG